MTAKETLDQHIDTALTDKWAAPVLDCVIIAMERFARKQVKNRCVAGVVKRSFAFDYLGKQSVNEEGRRVAECLTEYIDAYDEEHAILLFKQAHPDTAFDPDLIECFTTPATQSNRTN